MKDPQIVVTVTGGIADVYQNPSGLDLVILDFDGLNEYGGPEDKAKADTLMSEGRYEELALFLQEL